MIAAPFQASLFGDTQTAATPVLFAANFSFPVYTPAPVGNSSISSPAPFALRHYQQDAVDKIFAARAEGLHRLLFVQATGCGKTPTLTEIIRRVRETDPRPVLFMAHREELLTQAERTLSRGLPSGVRIDFEWGDRRAAPNADVILASVGTIARAGTKRLDWLERRGVSAIGVDECHHAVADGYVSVFRRFGCFDHRQTFLFGCTATPDRLDNRSLDGDDAESVFQQCVSEYGLLRAINEGYLCPLRCFIVRTQTDLRGVKSQMGDFSEADLARRVMNEARTEVAVNEWKKLASDRLTIVFCVSVEHAESVAAYFREQGIAAESIHGGMKGDDRQAALGRFRRGQTQVLVNCQIATEGFDVPAISCVVMLRPTKSRSLYSQMAGRGTRLFDGKKDCLILDIVDLCDELSLASAPQLVGLPAGLDVEGASISQVKAEMDDLGERQKFLSGKPGKWKDLATQAREVFIFAPPKVSETAVQAGAKMRWFNTAGAGASGTSLTCFCQNGRRADLVQKPLGYEVTLSCPPLTREEINEDSGQRIVREIRAAMTRTRQLPAADSDADALFAAEAIIRRVWPETSRFSMIDASCNRKAATPKQLTWVQAIARAIKAEGFDITAFKTGGDASGFIDMFKDDPRVKEAAARRAHYAGAKQGNMGDMGGAGAGGQQKAQARQ